MSSNLNDKRPLSPHLGIYKPIPTMVSSILHRITGVALYMGTILLAAWLVTAAMGEAHYECFMQFMGSWFGRLIFFGFTWALVFHALGGIRHLVQDTGRGLEKHFTTNLAYIIFILSLLITLVLWVFGYNGL